MSSRRRGILWFAVMDMHGRDWQIRLVPDEPAKGACGLCDYDTRTILVDVALCDNDLNETLLHEFQHASFDCVEGIKLPYKVEEKIVSTLSPPLWALLAGSKVRWPRKPRGYKQLKEKAKNRRVEPHELIELKTAFAARQRLKKAE